jgi:hypothetical protein
MRLSNNQVGFQGNLPVVCEKIGSAVGKKVRYGKEATNILLREGKSHPLLNDAIVISDKLGAKRFDGGRDYQVRQVKVLTSDGKVLCPWAFALDVVG